MNPNPPPAPQTPAPKKTAKYVDVAPKIVALDDPIECDGEVYDAIHVMRLTIGKFRAHTDAGGKADILQLQMFQSVKGQPVPIEVMEALSVRDANTITEVANGFLTGRQAAEAATPSSTSATGAP